MSARIALAFSFILVLACTARGQIELLSIQEDPERPLTTIKLGVTSTDSNVQTELTLRYPGSVNKTSKQDRTMLANQQASIAAFNFRAGTQANDCVALALSASGRLVYYFDFNNGVTNLVAKWKEKLNEGSFRVVNVSDDVITLEYYEHVLSSRNKNFRVTVHVLPDGNLSVTQGDLKDVSP